jgi:hypothetical protein
MTPSPQRTQTARQDVDLDQIAPQEDDVPDFDLGHDASCYAAMTGFGDQPSGH